MFWFIDQFGLAVYAVGVFVVYAVGWYFVDPLHLRAREED